MKRTRDGLRAAPVIRLAVSTALVGAALCTAEPAHADQGSDEFVSDLASSSPMSGLTGIDPGRAADVGKSVCPMLSEPGQQMADVASDVSDEIGRPMGPATMFTGLAISVFCPMAMTSMMNGESPIPFGMFGG